jgi:hypothetical protein
MLRKKLLALIDKVEGTRGALEASEAEMRRKRSEYHAAVGDMARAGMTVREIGKSIGISHQRVQQILDELVCLFCGAGKYDGVPFVGGGGHGFICLDCLHLAQRGLRDKRRVEDDEGRIMLFNKRGPERCDFCEHRIGDPHIDPSHKKIDALLTHKRSRICNGCIKMYAAMLAQSALKHGAGKTA